MYIEKKVWNAFFVTIYSSTSTRHSGTLKHNVDFVTFKKHQALMIKMCYVQKFEGDEGSALHADGAIRCTSLKQNIAGRFSSDQFIMISCVHKKRGGRAGACRNERRDVPFLGS